MDVAYSTAGQKNKCLDSATTAPTLMSAAAVLTHHRGKRGTRSQRRREARRFHASKQHRRATRRRWLGVSSPARLNEDMYRARQRWIEKRKLAARKKRKAKQRGEMRAKARANEVEAGAEWFMTERHKEQGHAKEARKLKREMDAAEGEAMAKKMETDAQATAKKRKGRTFRTGSGGEIKAVFTGRKPYGGVDGGGVEAVPAGRKPCRAVATTKKAVEQESRRDVAAVSKTVFVSGITAREDAKNEEQASMARFLGSLID